MRHFWASVSAATWMTAGVTCSCASVLTINYLIENTEQAARQRCAAENAAVVRAARAVYARSGCSTIRGEQLPDLSYLPHVDCECHKSSDIAAADGFDL